MFERGGDRTRTSVDERPSTHVYAAPYTPSLGEVPPEPILVTEHVSPRLLIHVQSFIVARRARVCWYEELVDRVTVSCFGVRQGERRAEKGAKACRAVQVNPRLQDVISRRRYAND